MSLWSPLFFSYISFQCKYNPDLIPTMLWKKMHDLLKLFIIKGAKHRYLWCFFSERFDMIWSISRKICTRLFFFVLFRREVFTRYISPYSSRSPYWGNCVITPTQTACSLLCLILMALHLIVIDILTHWPIRRCRIRSTIVRIYFSSLRHKTLPKPDWCNQASDN